MPQEIPRLEYDILTGTEIVEILKKLIESRGLYMKSDIKNIFHNQETYESDEDDSRYKMTESSISLSYIINIRTKSKTSSSSSLKTWSC
jgi:hypothetical protein